MASYEEDYVKRMIEAIGHTLAAFVMGKDIVLEL